MIENEDKEAQVDLDELNRLCENYHASQRQYLEDSLFKVSEWIEYGFISIEQESKMKLALEEANKKILGVTHE